jgi:hypothetical protein
MRIARGSAMRGRSGTSRRFSAGCEMVSRVRQIGGDTMSSAAR